MRVSGMYDMLEAEGGRGPTTIHTHSLFDPGLCEFVDLVLYH